VEWKTASSAYTGDQTGLTADERITFLFQPDTLLSAQYFENLRRKTLLEPEKRLMLAILEDAINSFQDNLLSPSVKGKKFFEEAEEWILDKDGDWIYLPGLGLQSRIRASRVTPVEGKGTDNGS